MKVSLGRNHVHKAKIKINTLQYLTWRQIFWWSNKSDKFYHQYFANPNTLFHILYFHFTLIRKPIIFNIFHNSSSWWLRKKNIYNKNIINESEQKKEKKKKIDNI